MLKKAALYVAGGALTATAAFTAAPAVAAPAAAPPGPAAPAAAHPRYTEGRVTARAGLKLRDKPTRGSRVIRTEPYGATVHIFCKTRGDHVSGNDHWYLLTDGTWAWGSARYIAPKRGHDPRWC
jgi:hypothetical protein